jgi:hypothetical protein
MVKVSLSTKLASRNASIIYIAYSLLYEQVKEKEEKCFALILQFHRILKYKTNNVLS